MLFSKEHREAVKTENPGKSSFEVNSSLTFLSATELTFGGIGKKLGEMWRGLTQEEKDKYMKPPAATED